MAALVCLYGGFLLCAVGLVLGELVSDGLGEAVMSLGWLTLFAVKFLLLAAVVTSFDKKP